MNYKITLYLGLIFLFLCGLFSFSPSPYQDLLLFMNDSDRISHYRYINNKEEKEYFTNKTEVIGGKEYTVKIIADVYGKKTKYYVRKGSYNFYQYDSRSNSEGILVPIDPKMGETWISADKSMKYEVIALEQRFQTPVKKYKKAIWIKGTPRSNPYGIQRAKNYIHYVKGEGLVAMTDGRGEFLKYLADIDK